MNKKLPAVGDLHIHGIVNLNGFMEFFVLQNTRLSLVMKMADVIAQSIKETDQKLSVLKSKPSINNKMVCFLVFCANNSKIRFKSSLLKNSISILPFSFLFL